MKELVLKKQDFGKLIRMNKRNTLRYYSSQMTEAASQIVEKGERESWLTRELSSQKIIWEMKV